MEQIIQFQITVSDSYWTRWQWSRIFTEFLPLFPANDCSDQAEHYYILGHWVFWDVRQCSLVGYTNLSQTHCLHLDGSSELAASNFKVELFYLEDRCSRCLLNLVSYQTTWCHIPGHQNLGSPLWEPPTTPSYIIYLMIYTCRHKYCMDVQSPIIWQILAHEMFSFNNSKRIKIILVVGIIPGQLWKPFALMNKYGRNWNTFSFLNTRQALVGRIRQQICMWMDFSPKTYTSYTFLFKLRQFLCSAANYC